MLWVSRSMQDEVVALAPDTLTVTARWAVSPEPRMLAVRAGGDELWGTSARGGQIHRITTATGEMTPFDLPRVRRFRDPGCEDRRDEVRASGEIAVDVASGRVFLPAWHADTRINNPIREDDGVILTDTGDDPAACGRFDPADATPQDGAGAGGARAYTGVPGGPGPDAMTPQRFAPSLVEIDPATGQSRAWLLTNALMADPIGGRASVLVRGVPTGLELLPSANGPLVVVALASSSAFVGVLPDVPTNPQGHGAFDAAPRLAIPTPAGPGSLRAVPGSTELRLWAWLQRAVITYDQAEVDPERSTGLGARLATVGLQASELDPVAARGRELVHRSDVAAMSLPGSGTSFSACHVDGRTDGLTWIFSDSPRQTPSLAGPADACEAVTWTGEVASAGEGAEFTVRIRMGGAGVTPAQRDEPSAYINSTRRVLLPARTPDQDALFAEGRALFQPADVGCAGCHQGALGASAQVVPTFGLDRVDVPALAGVAATAPYLHDGSAPTLRDVLLRARDGSMGDTSALDADELLALETYLRFF